MDRFKRINKPYFTDDTDYTTNSPSYYDALARFSESLRLLTERMKDVEQRFKDLILEWLEDGTLAGLLEQVLLDKYATKEFVRQAIEDLHIEDYATIEWVTEQLNEYIELVNQLITDVNLRMDQLETDLTEQMNQLRKDMNDLLDDHKQDVIEIIESKEIKSNGGLFQNLQMELFTGFGSTQIFEGSQNSPQGITFVHHEGKDKIFMLTRVEGSSWESNEFSRITEYNFKDDGTVSNHVQYSNKLKVGHQGLSHYIDETGQLWFYTGATTGNKPNSTKGFSKVKWRGSSTSQSDVTSYQVLGKAESSHNLKDFNNATVCVTDDGKYLIMEVSNLYGANSRYMIIFDREQVESNPDPLCVTPLNLFKIDSPSQIDGQVTQDLTCDGTNIYIFSGYTEFPSINAINIYTLNGRHLGYYAVEGALGDYSLSQLKNGHELYGNAQYFEAEGITRKDGKLMILTNDIWKDNADNYTRRTQKLHMITTEKNENSKPINRGFMNIESPASLHLRGNAVDLSIPKGDAFQLSFWNEFDREFKNMISYNDESNLRLYDGRDESDNERYSQIGTFFNASNMYTIFRSDRNNNYGSGFNAHSFDSDTSGRFSIHFGNPLDRFYFDSNAMFLDSDGKVSLGTANHKFSEIFASDGAIKTSDKNYKQNIESVPDEVLNAWEEIDYKSYKMKQAVTEKGDEARKHIGLIAQDIIKAFEKHDLNAFDYGIVGYDEWEEKPEIIDDETGEVIQTKEQAGSIYSIRADECLFLESALMRRELNRMKEMLKGDQDDK